MKSKNQNKENFYQYEELIGASEHISKLKEEISYVAQKIQKHDLSVLILGESGTGKELIAKAISEKSGRTNFIAVNCAALPGNLFESELFGYVKGAFTGAIKDKPGLIEEARDGILFLDEIGDLAPDHQGKLLRLLQNKTYIPLGDIKEKNISDIRIITATNKDLGKEIKQGRFREDLYYRLNHRVIRTIPLKDRRSDIVCLLNHFIKQRMLNIDPKCKALFYSYDFPGNVRELESLLYSADDYHYIKNTLIENMANQIGKDPKLLLYDTNEIYKEMRFSAETQDSDLDAVRFINTIKKIETNDRDWESETQRYEILILLATTDHSKETISRILSIRPELLSPKKFENKFGIELPPRGKIQQKMLFDALRLYPDFESMILKNFIPEITKTNSQKA